ncbi:DUF6271 family protein [Streptoalloteichus hindustanus]|uniref:Uncharacterized protein n=1 Tax=Streptoalloteichus hindustanus TaxID=2017 RepID=A0A1M5P0V8_STRHI|nr:DUF6271 family protein [Streptoalloteichus hindustanus]SHG95345.1 hypothetical protein SAMN05444320_11729 [Streptoalloteichus hindustanus]
MRRICLTLPTNRACAATITALGEEAAYAATHFGVEVVLLVLDSTDERTFAEHASAIHAARRPENVTALHMDEAAQRAFLRQVIDDADVVKPDLLLDLMLPNGVSYGACTNRAFLIASALGCRSVHRRDSDSRYQVLHGATVFPIHHELTSLGRRAADAAAGVSETALDPAHAGKPVVMVGSSFIGELSVDIGEIARLNPEVYYDVVSLWAPGEWSDAEKRQLVDESFTGARAEVFTHDRSVLTLVDPMRVDMCNVGFHQIHEQVPLPPATDTIGSDYFLLHLAHDAQLPGVLHNRNIVNFYTPERKNGPGFAAYHLRLTKFFLSMLYFHDIYRRMAEAGEALLDDQHRVRASVVAEFARRSTGLAKDENVQRLERLDRAYRRLGGRYEAFADSLVDRRAALLREAEQDIEDFALLIDSWEHLVARSGATDLARTWPSRRPGQSDEHATR